MINDLTINAGERAINIINKASTVELNNVTATAKNNAVMIATSAGAVKLTINDSDLTGLAVVNVAGAGAEVEINNTDITNVDASSAENYGAITIWSSAEAANVTVNGGNITVGDDSREAYVFPADATIEGVEDVGYIVATIGDAGFESLQAAINKAKAGQTIELIRDITEKAIITIDKAITINGNGNTLTSTAARAINIDTTGNVVINDLTINAGERAINIINKASTVELNNVTATAKNNAVMIATSAGAVKLTINDSDLTGLAVVNVAGAGAEVEINNTDITNVDASSAENYGAITIWSSAEAANVTVNGGNITVGDDSREAYVFPADATIEGVEDVGYIVATIGDAGFESLQAAINKAKAGQTIELIRDITEKAIITIDKAITINGNGNTLTSTAARAINVTGADGVVIKNLTVTTTGERAINVIQGATNLTLDNVTATASNYAVNIAGSASNAVVTIKNSTLTGLNTVNVAAVGADVTITGSTITCNDQNTSENYGALLIAPDAKDAKITAADVIFDIKGDSYKAANNAEGGVLTIDGSTEGVHRDVAIIEYANGYIYSFATLQGAIDYAKPGETVKLIDNAFGDGVIIDKNVVIDLNGKTYTFNGTLVGSTGTKSCGFQILEGNTVTIKNGALVMDEAAVRGHDGKTGNNFVIQNYANLTLENVSVKGNSKTSYVVSINSGNVALTGNTSIEGNNVAFDVCKYLSYAAPNVTVNTTGTITGKVEVSGGALDLQAATIDGELVYISGSVEKAEAVTLAAPEGYKWVNGVLTAKTYVAQVGEQKFESLAEAITAANGETVKLIDNAFGDGVIIDKNVVIDLNGKTYTFNGTLVGSTGTKSCGFQILEGNTVTIKNGALVMDEAAVRGHDGKTGNNFVIQNYANLTLENVSVKGNSKTSYVVSINSGNVALTGNTSIEGNNVAFDVCKYLSYAAPNVTVNTTGTITGKVEVSGGALDLQAATIDGELVYISGSVEKAEAVTLAAPEGYNWVNGVLTAKTDCEINGHKYESETFDATCTEDGKIVYTCVCGDSYEETIKAQGHSFAEDGYCTVCDAENAKADFVAQIGEKKYLSLKAAIDAAAGDAVEIKLLKTVVGEGLVIDKNVTINFNGYKYIVNSVAEGIAAIKITADVKLVGNGGGFSILTRTRSAFGILVLNEGTLTTENVLLNGNELYYQAEGQLPESWVVYNKDGAKAIFNEGTKIQTSWRSNGHSINVGDFTSYCDSANVKAPDGYHWAANKLAEHTFNTRVVVGATDSVNGCIKHECECGEYIVEKYFRATAAKVEMNGAYYLTLADALDVAVGGETITLLNTVVGEGLVINKNVTINFNGYKYVVSSVAEGIAAIKITAEVKLVGNGGGFSILTRTRSAFGILILNEGTLTTENVVLNGNELYHQAEGQLPESWVVYNGENATADLSGAEVKTSWRSNGHSTN